MGMLAPRKHKASLFWENVFKIPGTLSLWTSDGHKHENLMSMKITSFEVQQDHYVSNILVCSLMCTDLGA